MSSEINKAITTAHEMDGKLIQAEKDLAYMKEFLERLKEIKKNTQDLGDYYFNSERWLHDRELLEKERPDLHLGVFSEDGIYNVYLGINDCVKQLVKEGAIFIADQ